MTFQQIKDERVEQAKNKIYSELMLLSYVIVVASFCVKSIYFGMTLNQCATEFIILVLAPVYQAVRSRQLGVVLTGGKNGWKQHLSVLVVVVLLFALLLARSHFSGQTPGVTVNLSAGLTFLAVFIVIFLALRFLALWAERRRAERLERRYDDEQ